MKKILVILGVILVVVVGIKLFAPKAQPPQTQNQATEQKQSVLAILVIDANGESRTFENYIEVGKSAADFVIETAAKNNLQLKTKEYAGMGILVEGVNGIENNNEAQKYWMFYVNNQASTVGLSQYIVKNSDLISLKFEKSNF